LRHISIANFPYTGETSVLIDHDLRDELKRINDLSQRGGVEYAGYTSWNGFEFTKPTARTDNRKGSVDIPVECLNEHVVYHTHPTPGEGLFSLPSERDFEMFVAMYPYVQVHLILERDGFLVVSFDWCAHNKPDPKIAYDIFTSFLKCHHVDQRVVTLDGFTFYMSDVSEWSYAVNQHVSSFTTRSLGLEIRFVPWEEDSREIPVLLRNVDRMMLP